MVDVTSLKRCYAHVGCVHVSRTIVYTRRAMEVSHLDGGIDYTVIIYTAEKFALFTLAWRKINNCGFSVTCVSVGALGQVVSGFPAGAFWKSLSLIISCKFLMYKIAFRNIWSFGNFLLYGWIMRCFRSSQNPSLIKRTRLRSRSLRFETVSFPRRPVLG